MKDTYPNTKQYCSPEILWRNIFVSNQNKIKFKKKQNIKNT